MTTDYIIKDESWFIASIPNHPFIVKIKKKIVSLNTYNKIKRFIRNNKFKCQKNVYKEYHLIYHIISYVQQKYPKTLKKLGEYDEKFLYPYDYEQKIIDIPFTNFNTFVINFFPIFDFLIAKKIIKYLKHGVSNDTIGSKLTSGIRKFIELENMKNFKF